MDTTITHQRNRLQSAPSSSGVGPNSTVSSTQGSTHPLGPPPPPQSQSPPPLVPSAALALPVERERASSSSFGNLFDGFAARVSAVSSSISTASTPSSTKTVAGGVGANTGSTASLTSIGSLGTTANSFYSSIGLAFNSLTSPISAAAAAASATTAEAAARITDNVVAAASAISNHLSSPTSGTPPHNEDDDDGLDEDEDCDDDDDEDEDVENDDDYKNVPATTRRKTWSEIKAIVNDMRKQLANLSSLVPTNIQFRTLSDGRLRCYFLSTPPAGWETTLLYADVNLNAEDEAIANAVFNETSNDGSHLENNRHNDGGGGGGGGHVGGASSPILRLGSPILTHHSSSQPGSPSTFGAGGGGGFGFGGASDFGSYHKKRLGWNLVLQQPISSVAAVAGAGANAWSREFQLLQERKRLSTWGITSYELHKPSGKIVFPCLSDLYQCLDTGYNTSPIFPTQLRTCPQWQALDPQICPQNSDLIAFVSGCDIWVTHTLSGHEERLTFSHDGRRPFADDPLSSGVPSYVMQEEFSRYQGYWWQPQANDGIYRIIYEEVDESDVCLYTFPSSQAVPGEMDEYRFPRTGTTNAKSKLKLVQFVLNESLQISDVCIKDLPYSLTVVFPWLEYIVRVGWTPDANYIWMQGMDRKQQRLDLILIPLDNFCETYSSSTSSPTGSTAEHSWKSPYCRSVSPLQVIYSQLAADTWINVHDLLYFLEFTETTVTFLWASEESGFRHLYLVTSSLSVNVINGGCSTAAAAATSSAATANATNTTKNATTTTTTTKATTPTIAMSTSSYEPGSRTNSTSSTQSYNMDVQTDCFDAAAITFFPRIINKVALTSGDWEVLGRNLWVDKAQQLVYFLGLRDTPLEKHLYVVSLQRPEHIRLLTEPGYSYLVEFDESCQLMLQVYCNIQRLPSCKIMRVQQTCQSGGVNGIQLSLIGYLHEGGKPEPQYCPQIYRPQLPSGEIVYAMVFKPHNFQLGVKYPTVLNVYGGPEVQTVNNTFKGKHQLRMHMLAAQGYCVVCIDSRGSRHRGQKFESHIRCRMGQVELNDQVDGLRILADQLGYIDMNRIAIHGWSYGGYLSLMGLVQFPDIFKIAIAGAPVTNWEYYDTGYTERYMDLPQNNKDGYQAGSVLNYINSFPEEDNRLLLIHGLIDENVHFYHTSQLITALNKANKPYDLHVFPDERHSLRNLESNKNYETKLLSFLQNL